MPSVVWDPGMHMRVTWVWVSVNMRIIWVNDWQCLYTALMFHEEGVGPDKRKDQNWQCWGSEQFVLCSLTLFYIYYITISFLFIEWGTEWSTGFSTTPVALHQVFGAACPLGVMLGPRCWLAQVLTGKAAWVRSHLRTLWVWYSKQNDPRITRCSWPAQGQHPWCSSPVTWLNASPKTWLTSFQLATHKNYN